MYDLILTLKDFDSFTIYMIVGLAGFVFWAIRELVGSGMLAMLFLPFLVIGGLAANYLFRVAMITLDSDKDSNVVVASAIGILVAMVLMIMAVWLAAKMKDRRVKARHLTLTAPNSRAPQ